MDSEGKDRENLELPTEAVAVTQGGPHPIFFKYTRPWLHAATGYSKGYLCRVATGKIPVGRLFMAKAAIALGEPEAALFLLKGAEGGKQP